MKVNFIGEQSLSSFIYKLLKFFLVLSVILVPLAIMITIHIYSKGGYPFNKIPSMGFSLSFIKQASNQFISNYSIKYLLYNIPGMIIGLLINYYLMKIFEDFSNYKIFEVLNLKRSRIIGLLIILSAIFENGGTYLAALTINNMSTNGVSFHTNITPMILDARYVYGLMIIIIAEIFRRAIILKNEQDLTI